MKQGRIRSRHRHPPTAKREHEIAILFLHTTQQLKCKCGAAKKSSFLEALNAGWSLYIPDHELIYNHDIHVVCPTCSATIDTTPEIPN